MEEMKRRELQRLIEYSRRNEERYTDNTAMSYIVKENDQYISSDDGDRAFGPRTYNFVPIKL